MNLARKLKTLKDVAFDNAYLYPDGHCLTLYKSLESTVSTTAYEVYAWHNENSRFKGRLWNLDSRKFV